MRLAMAAAVALALASTGAGAWSTTAAGSGKARGGQLVGNVPTATKSGVVTISVDLSWAATTGATGYRVQRTGGVGSVGGSCTGTISATSCTDSPVTPLTTYSYTVTPLAGSWTGTASPATTIST